MRSHWLVSRFALSGMDMSCKNYDNRTALHVAATQGHLNIVKFLVEKCSVAHDIKDRYAIQSGSPYPILVIRVILAIPSGSVHVNPILAIPSGSANAGLPTFSHNLFYLLGDFVEKDGLIITDAISSISTLVLSLR